MNNSDVIISEAIAVFKEKEKFLATAKNVMSNAEYKQFVAHMSTLETRLGECYSAVLDNALALNANISARKKVKIDPAIAGGLVDGVAGTGAGIYTALSAKERNQKIDKQRLETQMLVNHTSSESTSSKRRVADIYATVLKDIENYDELKKIHAWCLTIHSNQNTTSKTDFSTIRGVIIILLVLFIYMSKNGGDIGFFGPIIITFISVVIWAVVELLWQAIAIDIKNKVGTK